MINQTYCLQLPVPMGTPKLVVSMILVLYFGQNELQNIKHFSFSMEIYAFAKCILLAFCLQTSNGRFWAANLFKLWKFSKFASISIPALCLEWIGSIRFSQKKGFLIVKNGQFLASKSWFDGKNSWKSNIVSPRKVSLVCSSIILCPPGC